MKDSSAPPENRRKALPRGLSLAAVLSGKTKCLLALAPVVLTVLIYSNTLNSPFTFDDEPNILNNPSIRLTRITGEELKKAAFQNPISNRPLAYLSFALNYYVHRHRVPGYHLLNILIHILAGFALWGILHSTLTLHARRPAVSGSDAHPQNAFAIACLVSLLWLAHPLHTQSVTYIVQRMNSMSAMFYLVAFYAYIKARLARSRRVRTLLLLCAILCGALAFASKENAITLPVMCFLYEWIFFRQADWSWLRKTILPFMAVLAALAFAASLTLGEYHLNTLLLFKGYEHFEFSLFQRVITEFRVLLYYISLLVYPHPARLNLEYDYPLSVSFLTPAATPIAGIALVALCILAVYTVRRKPLLSFCLLWFLVNHLLESSFISLAIIYEYRNYLPSSLPVLLVPVLLTNINRSFFFLATCLALPIFVFAVWSHQRNGVWSDEITLWRDCAAKTPGIALPHENLAVALAQKNRLDEAFHHIRAALELHPYSPLTNTNMGFILEKRGSTDAARSYYRKALEIAPTYVPALNNLANSLADDGNFGEAIDLYRRALRAYPGVDQTHFNLALALIETKNPAEAEHHLRQAILLNPEHPKAPLTLALALVKLDRIDDAIGVFQKIFHQAAPDGEMFRKMGMALIEKGKYGLAREYLEEAVSINPADTVSRLSLASALLQQGRVEDALRQFAGLFQAESVVFDSHLEFKKAFSKRLDRDRAIVHLVRMLEKEPDNHALLYLLGSLHHENRDFLAAMAAYQSSLALAPGFLPALFDLARIHAEMRNFDRALSLYKIILAKRPDIAVVYYNIACIHALQNDIEKALEWLSLSIDKGFNRWEYMATDPDLRGIRDRMDFGQWIIGKKGAGPSE